MRDSTRRSQTPDRQISRGFRFIVSLFVAICLSLLAVGRLQSFVLDSVRCYVSGEGLWSKGQKDAIFHLTQYVLNKHEREYQAFLRGISVTLGDHQARLALQQPDPDFERARDGFLQGGNNPADISSMIHFFLWFHDVSYIASAIDIWTQGDERIAQLLALGKALHAEVRANDADNARIQGLLAQADRLNQQLTVLEKRFSATLGEGARWAKALMQEITAGSLLLLLMVGIFVSWRIFRGIRETEQAQRIAAAVFHASAEGIIVTDNAAIIQAANPAYVRITGYDVEELLGRNPSMFDSGQHDAEFYRQMWQQIGESGHWQGEIWNRRKDGQVYPAWLSISAIRDGGHMPTQYVGIYMDITDRKERENLIWHQAHFDSLTDLPNRSLVYDRLAQSLRQARRDKDMVAVLFIDCDHFKDVNDSLGHKIGDQLLQLVSARLKGNARESDTVGRLGGDEFIIILPHMHGKEDVEHLAAKVCLSCAHPYEVEGYAIETSVSIGVAVYPQDADTAEALVHKADTAMYAAKQVGRGTSCFYADVTGKSPKP